MSGPFQKGVRVVESSPHRLRVIESTCELEAEGGREFERQLILIKICAIQAFRAHESCLQRTRFVSSARELSQAHESYWPN